MSTETKQGPNVAGVVALQFGFTNGVFRQNTDGVTHAESLVGPKPAGNCMNWIVAHLLVARNSALALLGEKPLASPEKLERFARGSAPLTDASEALDWDGLRADWEKAQEGIQAGLGRITAERLAAPLPEDRNPFRLANVGEVLSVLVFHETYHVGQLGLIRRTLGKEGAIR
jgi:DinB superfamily